MFNTKYSISADMARASTTSLKAGMEPKPGMYVFLLFYLKRQFCSQEREKKCYWSLQDGNQTSIWSDARLTEVGKSQAQTAHDAWRKQIENQIPFPEIFYVSPLNRCLQTAFITFDGLEKDVISPFRPTVKEVCSHPLLLSFGDQDI